MIKALFLPTLLAAWPLLATAQNSTQDSLLRAGNLVGGRPAATQRHASARRTPATTADPYLASLLHESIDLSRIPASRMLALYDNFIEAVRAERRTWSTDDWTQASDALGRINARYEAVRQELPLSDRLAVRTVQGEFRTLQGARRLKDSL